MRNELEPGAGRLPAIRQTASLRYLVAIAALLLLVFALAPPVKAQVFPATAVTLISATNVVGAFTTNILGGAIEVPQGRGLALFAFGACTNASGSNVVVTFDASYDGSNYSTYAPGLVWTFPNNGTTAFRAYTNFSALTLDNVRRIRVRSIQNVHLSTLFITNIVASRRNL